jgi:hypothetical protein
MFCDYFFKQFVRAVVRKTMQLIIGAEHFGNVIFRYSELPSQYHIDLGKKKFLWAFETICVRQ